MVSEAISRTWSFLFSLEGKFFLASTASQRPRREAWECITLKCRGSYTLAMFIFILFATFPLALVRAGQSYL